MTRAFQPGNHRVSPRTSPALLDPILKQPQLLFATPKAGHSLVERASAWNPFRLRIQRRRHETPGRLTLGYLYPSPWLSTVG